LVLFMLTQKHLDVLLLVLVRQIMAFALIPVVLKVK